MIDFYNIYHNMVIVMFNFVTNKCSYKTLCKVPEYVKAVLQQMLQILIRMLH